MMRRTVGIMLQVALAFVLSCGVVAAGSTVSGSLTAARAITQKVDLEVNVDKWAAIEIDNSEPMALELERPEASARVAREITVKANTKVSVSVDKPALYLSQDDAGELSEARKYPDNGYAILCKSDRMNQVIKIHPDLNPVQTQGIWCLGRVRQRRRVPAAGRQVRRSKLLSLSLRNRLLVTTITR